VGPLFELGSVDLDGRATETARQVVVVGFHDAAPVETLTAIGHHDVDVAVVDQFLELV